MRLPPAVARRLTRRAALVLGAVTLLAVLVGATVAPPGAPHAHPLGFDTAEKTVTVGVGEQSVSFECPTGYVLLWFVATPDLPIVNVVPTAGGQGGVITFSNTGPSPVQVTLRGICVRQTTGKARDRRGGRHVHRLGEPEWVEQTVHLDPFTGYDGDVTCPQGARPTAGLALRDPSVELQASRPTEAGAWRFQVFNPGRTDGTDVRLRVLCAAVFFTLRAGTPKHAHPLLLAVEVVVSSLLDHAAPARRRLEPTEASFAVDCPAGYRPVGGGYAIPEGFFEPAGQTLDATTYTLTVEASSILPTVEVAAVCLGARTGKVR